MPLGILMQTKPVAPVEEDGIGLLSKRRIAGNPTAVRQITNESALQGTATARSRRAAALIKSATNTQDAEVDLGVEVSSNVKNQWWYKAILEEQVFITRKSSAFNGESKSPQSPRSGDDDNGEGEDEQPAYMTLASKPYTLQISGFPMTIPPALTFLKNLPSSLLILELRNCGLKTDDVAEALFFSECLHVKYLCLANNMLTSIPIFIDKLTELQILDLGDNFLSHSAPGNDLTLASEDDGLKNSAILTDNDSIQSMQGNFISNKTNKIHVLHKEKAVSIVAALQEQEKNRTGDDVTRSLDLLRTNKNLVYVNFQGNVDLCSASDYRDMICSCLPNLLALDSHIVCDEEKLDSNSVLKRMLGIAAHDFFDFKPPFCAGNAMFRIPELFYEPFVEESDADRKEEAMAFSLQSQEDLHGDMDMANPGGNENDNTSIVGSVMELGAETNAYGKLRENSWVGNENEESVEEKNSDGNNHNIVAQSFVVDVKATQSASQKRHYGNRPGVLFHLRYDLDALVSLLRLQYKRTSPVVKIQRVFRAWFAWKNVRGNLVRKEITKCQAHIRRWLLSKRCEHEWQRLLMEAGVWEEPLSDEEKASIEAARQKAILLRRTQHLSHYVLILTKFFRYAIVTGTKRRAATKINRWVRSYLQGWHADLAWLLKNNASNLVVLEEESKGAVTLFKFYHDRAVRKGIHSSFNLENNLEYKSVQLSRMRLHDQRSIKNRRNKYLTRGIFFANKGKMTLPVSIQPKLLGFWRVFATKAVTPQQRHSARILKPRGNGLINKNILNFTLMAAARTKKSFHERGKSLSVISFKSIITSSTASLLSRTIDAPSLRELYVLLCVIRSIRSRKKTEIVNKHQHRKHAVAIHQSCQNCWFLHDIVPQAAATVIQATWRGVFKRQKGSNLMLNRLLNKRAVIALQRWWRMRNGLYRRFKMLESVHNVCKNLSEPVLYMDLWSYYWCLKQPTLPQLPSTLHLFPEFRTVPFVSFCGNAVLKPIESDAKDGAYWEDTEVDLSLPTLFRGGLDTSAIGNLGINVSVMNTNGTITKDDIKSKRKENSIKGRPRGSLWNPAIKHRNINLRTGVRFGMPLWASFRPDSELFWQGKLKGNEHISNKEDMDREYSYPPSRYAKTNYSTALPLPGGGNFVLFDLLTKHVNVRSRSLTLKYTATKGVVDAPTDADADIRVVSLNFSSLYEARARCALIIMSTYDAITHTGIIPMSEQTLLVALSEKRQEIRDHNWMLQQDTKEADTLKQVGNSANNRSGNNAANVIGENHGSDIDVVVAPVENRIFLQNGSLPKWIESKEITMWDVARFRFMCNSLVVCSNMGYMVDIGNAPGEMNFRTMLDVRVDPEKHAREVGRELTNQERDNMLQEIIMARRFKFNDNKRLKAVDRGLLTYSMMSEFSSLPNYQSRVWEQSTISSATDTAAEDMMSSVQASLDESEKELSVGDKQGMHYVQEAEELGAWGQPLEAKKSKKYNFLLEAHIINTADRMVIKDGIEYNCPHSARSDLTEESTAYSGAKIEFGASDDGFESMYSGEPLNKRQISLRQGGNYPREDVVKKQSTKPLTPALFTIRRAVSNSTLAEKMKTTAAMAFLRSNVWDVHRMLLWVSRGVELALETAASSMNNRQVINERKVLVSRLEALQLGLYEHSIRTTRKAAMEHLPTTISPIDKDRSNAVSQAQMVVPGFNQRFGPFTDEAGVAGIKSDSPNILSPRSRAKSPPYNVASGNETMIDTAMRTSCRQSSPLAAPPGTSRGTWPHVGNRESPPTSTKDASPTIQQTTNSKTPKASIAALQDKKRILEYEFARHKAQEEKEKIQENAKKSREQKRIAKEVKRELTYKSGQVFSHVRKTQENQQQTAQAFHDKIRISKIENNKRRSKGLPPIEDDDNDISEMNADYIGYIKAWPMEEDRATAAAVTAAATNTVIQNRAYMQDVRRTSSHSGHRNGGVSQAHAHAPAQDNNKIRPFVPEEISHPDRLDLNSATPSLTDHRNEFDKLGAPLHDLDYTSLNRISEDKMLRNPSFNDSNVGLSPKNSAIDAATLSQYHSILQSHQEVEQSNTYMGIGLHEESGSIMHLSGSVHSHSHPHTHSADEHVPAFGMQESSVIGDDKTNRLNGGSVVSFAAGNLSMNNSQVDMMGMIAASAMEFPGSVVRTTNRSHVSAVSAELEASTGLVGTIRGDQNMSQMSVGADASVVDVSKDGNSSHNTVQHPVPPQQQQQTREFIPAPKYKGLPDRGTPAERAKKALAAKKQREPHRDLLLRPPSAGYHPVYQMQTEEADTLTGQPKPRRPKSAAGAMGANRNGRGSSSGSRHPRSPRLNKDLLLHATPVQARNPQPIPDSNSSLDDSVDTPYNIEANNPSVTRPAPPWMKPLDASANANGNAKIDYDPFLPLLSKPKRMQ